MTKWNKSLLEEKHCRWCQKEYQAKIPQGRDGFHSNACKVALNRAYKKYLKRKKSGVTQKKARGSGSGSRYRKLSNDKTKTKDET